MAAKVQVVEVGTAQEMETAISSYVVQGYALANKTPSSATMMKRKEFSALWAVIGFLVCILPLLVYLIMYATETDKVVEIRLRGAAAIGDDNLSELERLKDLHDRGVVNDEEYETQKKKLLG